MEMSEADMEQYAQMLDELCEKDPQAYEQLMQMMREQVAAATAQGGSVGGAGPSQPPAADTMASMMDRIKTAASGATNGAPADAFTPRFPGNKVMEKDGIAAKQEGIHIEVAPGFVMKTTDLKKKQKVFVNICHSSAIQTFSQRKQLDDEGNEQEGIHVPLSLGAPHEVVDKSGNKSIAFDVAVNTQVVDDCKADKTGSFRNFVCELAIEYIDQKYKIQLDPRYKLPKLTYRGELPPPKHYIRKEQKPIIEEVSKPTPASTAAKKKLPESEKKAKQAAAVAAKYDIYELTGSSRERTSCTRVAAVEANGTALSKDMLQRAGSHLAIRVSFTAQVTDPAEIDIELRSEHLSVKSESHLDLALFLPFPVRVDEAEVSLDLSKNVLEVVAPIDKAWEENEPDRGSAPWLLAQALRDEEDEQKTAASQKQGEPEKEAPKSLVEMFHLAMPQTQESSDSRAGANSSVSGRAQWDPVDEDEELPEDRFHRKDMMSMHILEQRKKERQEKAAEADAKRKVQRAEVEEKQRKAKEAGKTWQEMYPTEPETTYIDFEEIAKQETQRRAEKSRQEDVGVKECIATETAKQVAAAWSVEKETHGLTLESALAFDLLD